MLKISLCLSLLDLSEIAMRNQGGPQNLFQPIYTSNFKKLSLLFEEAGVRYCEIDNY